jgi:hypothetical protein
MNSWLISDSRGLEAHASEWLPRLLLLCQDWAGFERVEDDAGELS